MNPLITVLSLVLLVSSANVKANHSPSTMTVSTPECFGVEIRTLMFELSEKQGERDFSIIDNRIIALMAGTKTFMHPSIQFAYIGFGTLELRREAERFADMGSKVRFDARLSVVDPDPSDDLRLPTMGLTLTSISECEPQNGEGLLMRISKLKQESIEQSERAQKRVQERDK